MAARWANVALSMPKAFPDREDEAADLVLAQGLRWCGLD